MTAQIWPDVIRAGQLLDPRDAARQTGPTEITVSEGMIDTVARTPDKSTGTVLHGDIDMLAMPALSNAHDHGRALRTLAFGAVDQPLETWLPALFSHPAVDPYISAATALARMARAGIAAVTYCQMPVSPESLMEHAVAVERAARDVGVRVAFVVPLRDRNMLAYGADDTALASLDVKTRERVRERWRPAVLPPLNQVKLATETALECEGSMFKVQFGPLGPQWCTDDLLSAVAEQSACQNMRVHMHLLETRFQREWADSMYKHGLVAHLDDIGLLNDRLTVAHGVWMRPSEWMLLAERGVTVCVNTSSNLRLRSGLAPVADMLRDGVPLAVGLDSLPLDDEDDMLRETRLVSAIHGGTGFRPAVHFTDVLTASMETGMRTITSASRVGGISAGMPADIVILNYRAMTEDLLIDSVPALDVLKSRGTSRYVDSLIVGGRLVVAASVVTGIDEAGVAAELTAQATQAASTIAEDRALLATYQAGLRRFYEGMMR